MSTMITVPFELTLDQLIDIVRQLDRPSRLKLIRAADQPEKPPQKRSILELRGLGKEVWAGIDVDTYINEVRNEWDG